MWNPMKWHDYSGIVLKTSSWHTWLLDGVPPKSFELNRIGVWIEAASRMSRKAGNEESWKTQWIKRWMERIHPTTQFQAFGLGFQALKTSCTRETSSNPSTPLVQKRHVLMAACRVASSWPAWISSRSTQIHWVNFGFFAKVASNSTTSPKATFFLPPSLRLMASKILLRWTWSRMPSSSCKNSSFTVRRPPRATIVSRLARNFKPKLSLWAHSASSSTLKHSCSSGTGQRDVNLAWIAHGAFTFYMVFKISLGLHMVFNIVSVLIFMWCLGVD